MYWTLQPTGQPSGQASIWPPATPVHKIQVGCDHLNITVRHMMDTLHSECYWNEGSENSIPGVRVERGKVQLMMHSTHLNQWSYIHIKHNNHLPHTHKIDTGTGDTWAVSVTSLDDVVANHLTNELVGTGSHLTTRSNPEHDIMK